MYLYFNCMVYGVFVGKIFFETVGFWEVTARGRLQVFSPEVGWFRLAHMIHHVFCNASVKLWHAILSWLFKVWLSTFSYSLVFQRMNNSSLAEQKLALWFWLQRFFPPQLHKRPCLSPLGTVPRGQDKPLLCGVATTLVMWDWGVPIPVMSHVAYSNPPLFVVMCSTLQISEPVSPALNRGGGSWSELYALDLLTLSWMEDAIGRAPVFRNCFLPSSLDGSYLGVLEWWLILPSH